MVVTQTNHYNSSTVKSSSYNYEHKVLTVHFDHATYVYENVTVEDYVYFASASSQGRALNEFIKGKYEFQKINETKETASK
jgi:acyl-CoA thioesterase